ncbi:probable ascorbate-specific transmembrane electron transporter 1 [Aristolochia californica]|uniref:probable ascorbate-specific transmembrane electron transporter 1 n=1 Tax=Aristolochia californica TaxID=171875 RepID=UPI0035D72A0E
MALGVDGRVFTYVSHVLAVASAVLVLVWCIYYRGGLAFTSTNKQLIFNVHPVLMLIGFVIIGSEAIISYKALPFSKEVKKLIHLVLHAIALVLGIVGVYAAFKYHNESGIANLYSLHSWLGLGTICLYAIQWIFGLAVFFFPGGTPSLRRGVLPWHVFFGLFVYLLALATVELGFLEKLTFLQNTGLDKYGPEAFLVNFNAIAVVLFGAFVILATISTVHVEDPHSYSPISDS